MTKLTTLTNLEIQVCSLIASGIPEIESASRVSRSRQWLTQQKKRPEFIQCIEEFSENFKNTLKENQKDAWLENIRDHQTKMAYASDKLFEVSCLMLSKLLERIKMMDENELKASNLANNLKSCADSFASAIDFDCKILGVDRIITEIKKIQKLTGGMERTASNLNEGDELID